ncbi:MAG: efflux RND transporter periplasmic adaptor subunit [Planctomycetia bacterium]|nr:efflux RND transporter periplasmic adaptor subunit [Planctomycetia bacterium]
MGATMADRWQSLRRRLWQIVKLVVLAAVVGGVVYWLKFAPVSVSVHQVERGDIVAEVMGTGTLEAHFKSTISPRISGRIQEVFVDMGDSVTAGKLLVKLDDVDMKPQVEIAQASVVVSRAALDRLQADRGQALAVLEQTTADHERALRLRPGGAISQEDVDKATAAWKIAQAGIARTDAALMEGRKQLIAAETSLAYRKALLGDTEIVAPFDGLIVQRQRDPGDIAVPGSAVLSLISTKELWITAWVDETEMSRVAIGQPARVMFRSEPDHAYGGEVTRLGRQADRETREFTVDVRVLELPKNWATAQRAEVYVQTARKIGVTVLPAQYILWRDQKPGVFVRKGQHAAWRDLTLGLRGRESVEVVAGLEPGDEVVVPTGAKDTAIEGRRISTP